MYNGISKYILIYIYFSNVGFVNEAWNFTRLYAIYVRTITNNLHDFMSRKVRVNLARCIAPSFLNRKYIYISVPWEIDRRASIMILYA